MAEPKNTNDTTDGQSRHRERSQYFIGELAKLCEKEGVKLAYAVVVDPTLDSPIVFTKGNTYPLTRLMVDITKLMKSRLDDELSI